MSNKSALLLILSFTIQALGGVDRPPVFKPDDVTKLNWTFNKKTVTFQRAPGGKWQGSQPNADWPIQRRLILLSQPASEHVVLDGQPAGEIEITTAKSTFKGLYNQKAFIWWSAGAEKTFGYSFADPNNENLAQLFEEGLAGFSLHNFKICDPKKVLEIKNEGLWALTKKGTHWLLTAQAVQSAPAKADFINDWLVSFCQIETERFSEFKAVPETLVLTVKATGLTLKLTKSDKLWSLPGHSPFYSEKLERLYAVKPEELKDIAVEDGKIALDTKLTVPQRLEAIRRIKASHSPEAVSALKTLVFEDTPIDVFRYEAVDALAAYGTRENMDIIVKRLEQVGRSGFQLRLARAVAAYLGHTFVSDEKTPEDTRQVEIRDLLNAYKNSKK